MIICEVGLNHLGNEDYSNLYFTKLMESDCDAITYQIREKEFYKGKYKDFELSFDYYSSLINKSKDKKFGIALADKNLIDECESIGVDFYKVLSWDLKDYEYIHSLLNKTSKPIYVSTGTSSLKDLNEFYKEFSGIDRISLIHTQLTQSVEDTNLKALTTLDKFGFDVGFGNHCQNLNVIYSSLAFNPSQIWFYVKGTELYHPDDNHSVGIYQVKDFIKNIKEVRLSIGDGQKKNTNTKGY